MSDPYKKIKIKKPGFTKDDKFTKYIKKWKKDKSGARKKESSGGRIGLQGGGRTNLLEELGRVEGESSNRNRRAEVSRIHGELNRGYSLGGRIAKTIISPVTHMRNFVVGAAKRGFNKKILRKD